MDFHALNQLQQLFGIALIVVILVSLKRQTSSWLMARATAALCLGAVVIAKQFNYPPGRSPLIIEAILGAASVCLAAFWAYKAVMRRRKR